VPSGIKLENSIGCLLKNDVHIFLPNDIINHPQMMQINAKLKSQQFCSSR
jgi:hypothetical protein